MADNTPQFLKTKTGEARKPDLIRLYGRRYRLTRYFDAFQGVGVGAADAGLFAEYGTPDTGDTQGLADLANLCLIDVGVGEADARSESTKKLRREVYETLTGTLVDEEAPVVDYELNGLKRVTHKLIALPGIDLTPYDFDVGESVYASDGDLILARFKDNSTDAATRVTVEYLEPGVISKSRSPGPIHGSIQHNWETWLLDAEDETDMGGEANTIPGEVTADTDSNYEGYKTRSFTSVAPIGEGTLAGVKFTYSDVVDVRVPGTVALTTQAVTAGDLSGTIAVPNVTPPTTKSIAATVTVEITTTPSGMSGTPAYDLGAISCSVVATQASYNANGFDSMSTLDGKNTSSAPRRSASIGARTVNYPGHYLVGTTSATGTFSYVGGVQYSRTSDGTVVSGSDLTSTDVNKLTGYGSTAATGYATTGIISRSKPRAVLQTLAGVTYYEVVTWSVEEEGEEE